MRTISPETVSAALQAKQEKTSVIFVHGFTSDSGVWDQFLNLLNTDTELANYEFLCWGYPTQFDLGYLKNTHRRLWVDDPNITTIGQGLRTFLNERAQAATKLILVGHSMGGLVIQAFLLEELLRDEQRYLDRLTEVILYGTPSGGLPIARFMAFLKNQVADMSDFGPFITKLRSEWQRLVDDRRADPSRLANFRLTLVAGMKDKFVPLESSQNPFKLDEKEIVPGDHGSIIKPSSAVDLQYSVLKTRLLRGSPTRKQRELILGESEEVLQLMSRIQAAASLNAVDDLLAMAAELLLQTPPLMPKVERELGLRLLDFEHYAKADALLERYLTFQMPDDRSTPFEADVQAWQQRAIALCGLGKITDATTLLFRLNNLVGKDCETQGILAGRFKWQWLKNPETIAIGWRAFNLYMKAFELAERENDVDQQIYNGINAAYLEFMLGGTEFKAIAQRVLDACFCFEKNSDDYWCWATRGEAYLLLGDEKNALTAYGESLKSASAPRYLSTSREQALHILGKRDESPITNALKTLFNRATFNT